MRSRFFSTCFLAVTVAVGLCACTPILAEDSGTPVLGVASNWRVFEVRADRVGSGDEPGVPFGPGMRTQDPLEVWAASDFEDGNWWRSTGPYLDEDVASFFLRGKFNVSDPTAVQKLSLALSYSGGVVIYLNGTEVLRRDLPDGTLSPTTTAEPYPEAAYLDAKGKLLPSRARIKKGKDGAPAWPALRHREVKRIDLPVGKLRKGTNVLAIELHRSSYHPSIHRTYAGRNRVKGTRGQWPHIGLHALSLRSEGDGIAPNVDRPDGIQVWNQDIHAQFGLCDYGDVTEPLRPIPIVGVRNGDYSGQVVVSSTTALSGVTGILSDLKATDGSGTIPATQTRVRYALPTTMGIDARKPGLAMAGYQKVPAFSPLADKSPATIEPDSYKTRPADRRAIGLAATMKPSAMQPVWITVSIPKDATAGKYTGTLTISADAMKAVKVPVHLNVIDWTVPAPRDYRTFISVYESPESVAVQYKVPLWSKKHWELLEASFKLLGYNGNRLLVIPLVTRTEYGNDESMVPWVRQADGSMKYDFTIHDRLIALAQKYCDLKVIAYQVYRSNGWGVPKPDKENFVTVVDEKTKKRGPMKLAPYEGEESTKQWSPLFKEIRKRFAKEGLAEGARPILGIGHDGGTERTVVAHFKQCFPEGTWQYGGHSRPRYDYLGYVEYLYVSETIPPPEKERRRGWIAKPDDRYTLMAQRIRDAIHTAMMVRTMGERALLLGDMGAGKMCLDYWPVEGSAKVMNTGLYSRWLESSAKQRSPHTVFLGYPGPNGAIPTFKYELMHEGLQETEARIFIEDALVNKKIDGDLATRVLALLDERADMCRMLQYRRRPLLASIDNGWQQRSADVYRLASEVAAVLKKP